MQHNDGYLIVRLTIPNHFLATTLFVNVLVYTLIVTRPQRQTTMPREISKLYGDIGSIREIKIRVNFFLY